MACRQVHAFAAATPEPPEKGEQTPANIPGGEPTTSYVVFELELAVLGAVVGCCFTELLNIFLNNKPTRDELATEFAKIDARFAKIDAEFAKIDTQFANIDAEFAKIDAQFGRIDHRLDILTTSGVVVTAAVFCVLIALWHQLQQNRSER